MSNYRFKSEPWQEEYTLDLKLYYCGREVCTPNHSWGPALKDHYKIHYIFSGKGTFETNNKIYQLKGGQGFLISPNYIATYKADCEDPWTYAWVAFNGRHTEMYLNQIGLSLDSPVFSCCKEDLLLKSFDQIFDACKKIHANDLYLLSSLYSFLAMIKESTTTDISNQKTIKHCDFYVKKALDFIQTNYSRNININELAEYLCLNRNYMAKIFKESTGMTPQAYLISFRMDRACRLMEDPYLSVGEIASSVGYKDQLLFSRMFRKVYGKSPSSYRYGL